MARKDLLKGLMDPGKPAPATEAGAEPRPTRVDAARPRYSKGAIGAVSQSIAELKSRSIVEVDPRMIDDAGFRDRLDAEDPGLEQLIESIRVYGQQVPVLLRPNPDDTERYQVVYGRRRVAALKALHLPIKAMVRELDDCGLVIAQGQENAARRDLTFIERANFARQMRDAGYDRKIICDALHVDKTLISRMLSVADRVPIELIEVIGSAPGIGRDRWLALADKLKGRDLTDRAVGESSDARFEAVMAALAQPRPPAPRPRIVTAADGRALAEVARKRGRTVLSVDNGVSAGFEEWLVENLARLHGEWQDGRED
ncbi:plasmid partitioning protein RepB [Rhodovulum sulfidophilum]|uniref:plasmid partitioning protein RepB n=1 Tax=Rhodovulum sulfidophilum TaxID=35806 RepID=UPI000952D446|nr:plasmid partitioning protein RepB [Rhodovulum sulfidophilum]MBL3552856.1 plasmid partitioning protein RepB [Rhodovulum sulfidophilum]OLS42635.1 plasmid partitioning protein RepB [Rhodovulum sulfidophilum]